MEGPFISLASSLERETLERLEKYLVRHGVSCWVGHADSLSERFTLFVSDADAGKARNVLQGISVSGDSESVNEEVVEIRCEEHERDAIAAWLQSLLDEQDEEGSPIFFYRPYYENLLDALLADPHTEVPVFLLRSLQPFLPEGSGRMMMSPALREFFQLIDVVSETEET